MYEVKFLVYAFLFHLLFILRRSELVPNKGDTLQIWSLINQLCLKSRRKKITTAEQIIIQINGSGCTPGSGGGPKSLTFVSSHMLWVGLYNFVVNKDPWMCSLQDPDHFQILFTYSINTNSLFKKTLEWWWKDASAPAARKSPKQKWGTFYLAWWHLRQ